MEYTFEMREVKGEYGHIFPLLTANEFPYINCQIVPTPPHLYDEVMAALHQRGDYIATAEGRTDFCVIQAGGTKDGRKIHITQENYKDIANAIRECMQQAANLWAKRPSKKP